MNFQMHQPTEPLKPHRRKDCADTRSSDRRLHLQLWPWSAVCHSLNLQGLLNEEGLAVRAQPHCSYPQESRLLPSAAKKGGISLKWLQRQQLFSTFKSSQEAVWTAIYPFLPLHWLLQAAVLEWEVGLQRKAQVASCRSACAIVDLRRKFYVPKKEKIGKHLIS